MQMVLLLIAQIARYLELAAPLASLVAHARRLLRPLAISLEATGRWVYIAAPALKSAMIGARAAIMTRTAMPVRRWFAKLPTLVAALDFWVHTIRFRFAIL